MTLKKYLTQFTKEQLVGQILELHKKYLDVQTYYAFSLNPDSGGQTDKVKERIHKLFNVNNGPKLREARKEISAFKKHSPSSRSLADAMLWYVECGIEFTSNYGNINEAFYISIEKMFSDVCEYIHVNGLLKDFKGRCDAIMNNTQEMGRGFHDQLCAIYEEMFEDI